MGWSKTKKSHITLSLFSGAGGLDYGLEKAGFQVSVAVEMDPWCCKTLQKNREFPVIQDKVENVSPDQLSEISKIKEGEAELLFGGPPCQPFSKSGYWVNGDTARLKDPRANTLYYFMHMLDSFLPQAFLLENVFGLAYKGKDEGLAFLESTLENINKKHKTDYSFQWAVLNSADFGVPQIRERVFIVGSRGGEEFRFPTPRFSRQDDDDQILLFNQLPLYRTAWDAIGDLNSNEDEVLVSQVGGKWGDLLPSIPPGENYLWHTERGDGMPLFKWRSRYWSFLLKLHPNRPSWTIQAQPGSAIGPFHWNNRRLTTREMARIQTFPDDVEILGGVSIVQKQLGNAVPSALAEVLGKEIRKQFFNEDIDTEAISLIPSVRSDAPREIPIAEVPDKYIEPLEIEESVDKRAS